MPLHHSRDTCSVCKSWLEEHGVVLDLEDELATLRAETTRRIKSLSVELQEQIDGLTAANAALAAHQEVEAGLRATIASLEADKAGLEADVAAERERTAEAEVRAQAAEGAVDDLKRANERLTAALDDLTVRHSKVQDEFDVATGRILDLEEAIRSAERKAKAAAAEAEARETELKADITDLHGRLRDSRAETERVSSRLARLRSELDEVRDQRDGAVVRAKRAEGALSTAEGLVSVWRVRAHKLAGMNVGLRKRFQEQTREVEALLARHAVIESERHMLEASVRAAHAEAEQLAREVEIMNTRHERVLDDLKAEAGDQIAARDRIIAHARRELEHAIDQQEREGLEALERYARAEAYGVASVMRKAHDFGVAAANGEGDGDGRGKVSRRSVGGGATQRASRLGAAASTVDALTASLSPEASARPKGGRRPERAQQWRM